MKNIIFLLSFLVLISCSKPDKNPLVIPPNFTEIPNLDHTQENKSQENIGNQENIDKLKKLLQESD